MDQDQEEEEEESKQPWDQALGKAAGHLQQLLGVLQEGAEDGADIQAGGALGEDKDSEFPGRPHVRSGTEARSRCSSSQSRHNKRGGGSRAASGSSGAGGQRSSRRASSRSRSNSSSSGASGMASAGGEGGRRAFGAAAEEMIGNTQCAQARGSRSTRDSSAATSPLNFPKETREDHASTVQGAKSRHRAQREDRKFQHKEQEQVEPMDRRNFMSHQLPEEQVRPSTALLRRLSRERLALRKGEESSELARLEMLLRQQGEELAHSWELVRQLRQEVANRDRELIRSCALLEQRHEELAQNNNLLMQRDSVQLQLVSQDSRSSWFWRCRAGDARIFPQHENLDQLRDRLELRQEQIIALQTAVDQRDEEIFQLQSVLDQCHVQLAMSQKHELPQQVAAELSRGQCGSGDATQRAAAAEGESLWQQRERLLWGRLALQQRDSAEERRGRPEAGAWQQLEAIHELERRRADHIPERQGRLRAAIL